MKLPFFTPKGYANAAAVSAAMAEHDTTLAVARDEHLALTAQRRDALLHGDDAALDAIDAKGRAAGLALDRLEARREALEIEHREHLRREADAALDAQRAAAEKRRDAARRWIATRYPTLAKDLVAGLNEIVAAELDVRASNAAMAEAVRLEEPLAPVESRGAKGEFGTVHPIATLAGFTRLVEIEGKAPGFGTIAEAEVYAASIFA